MDTDELMSAVPVPLDPEPDVSQLEAADVDTAINAGVDDVNGGSAAVDHVHTQLSDVDDTDNDVVGVSTVDDKNEPQAKLNVDDDVVMAAAVDEGRATDGPNTHADVASVDDAVGTVGVEVSAENLDANKGNQAAAGHEKGDEVDYDEDEDEDEDDEEVEVEEHGMRGSAGDMALVAAGVHAEPSRRQRTSSSDSSSGANANANTNANKRSVGRLRVNDKGEPTMMLPSFIWDYFVKEANGKFVVCTLCPSNVTRFAYSGGTSTMNRHLRKKHHKYAPGKTAADYEYPRASKRALAAALANANASNGAAVGANTHATTAASTATSTRTPTVVAAAEATASLNAVAMSQTASSASASSGAPPSAAHHHYTHSSDAPTTSASMALGSLSPSETTRRQLIDLRNARRRATTAKRRKIIHGMLDSDQYAAGSMMTTASTPIQAIQSTTTTMTEFDPSGFVTLHTPNTIGINLAGGLQFPPGFELGDAGGLDPATLAAAASGAGDVRLFDYATTSLLSGAVANSLLSNTNAAVMAPLYAPRGGFGTTGRRNPQQHKLLTHRLLKYLIAQYEPLDVSRMGAELSALVSGTDYPSHSNTRFLPSEETLKLALANLYYSQREMLKEVIAEVDVLSLSLNNWKSVFGQNVLTVSGHWISQGFSRRDCVLEVYVLPLDESVNTIALLRDVMDKWDIPANKVAALTMLKNGKEEKAIHEEYPGLTVVNCFVSVLDNAVSAGLMKCAPLIRRCRNYVSYFIQNPSEYQIFLSLQRKVAEANLGLGIADPSSEVQETGEDDSSDGKTAHGQSESPKLSPHVPSSGTTNAILNGTSAGLPLPALSVICDFEDRWNSTSEMICRIVELEQMLMLYKSNLESDTNPNRRPMQLRFVCCELSADEWANLKELARLLEPIEGVVHVATNCEYPGLSIILPLVHSIRKHLDHAELWIGTSLVSAVRNSISTALAAAQPLCSCGAMPPSSPYLSCLLDPRFKMLPFLEQSERDPLIDMLKVLHMELFENAGNVDKDTGADHEKRAKATAAAATLLGHSSGGKKGGILNAFFPASETHESTNEHDKLKAHVQLYLDSPSLPPTDDRENDPLDWWSRYVRSFPWLAKLAKKYLCMSAVSVPFYEAFTNYGQLMREKKARLDIEVAAQILFCRSVSRIPEMERMNV